MVTIIDLKENGKTLDKVLELVKSCKLPDSRLWFNAKIDDIEQRGFQKVVNAHPLAIVQYPIDEITPLILHAQIKQKKF